MHVSVHFHFHNSVLLFFLPSIYLGAHVCECVRARLRLVHRVFMSYTSGATHFSKLYSFSLPATLATTSLKFDHKWKRIHTNTHTCRKTHSRPCIQPNLIFLIYLYIYMYSCASCFSCCCYFFFFFFFSFFFSLGCEVNKINYLVYKLGTAAYLLQLASSSRSSDGVGDSKFMHTHKPKPKPNSNSHQMHTIYMVYKCHSFILYIFPHTVSQMPCTLSYALWFLICCWQSARLELVVAAVVVVLEVGGFWFVKHCKLSEIDSVIGRD